MASIATTAARIGRPNAGQAVERHDDNDPITDLRERATADPTNACGRSQMDHRHAALHWPDWLTPVAASATHGPPPQWLPPPVVR